MRRLFRWLFRLVLGLVILGVLGAVAAILLLDTMARELLISRLRSKTGMEAKISAVHVGLLSPTISIEGFKLYNTPDFGGTVCVDIPELHLEYDPSALRRRQYHLTLMRLNLAELSMVLDKQGRNNFFALKKKDKQPGPHAGTGGWFKFTGIDVMNVTLGTFRLSNLASGHGEQIDFGIKNQVLRNVKSEADLAPLGFAVLSRGKATSAGGSSADLSQLLDSLFKSP